MEAFIGHGPLPRCWLQPSALAEGHHVDVVDIGAVMPSHRNAATNVSFFQAAKGTRRA
jgi:hypothetical protein